MKQLTVFLLSLLVCFSAFSQGGRIKINTAEADSIRISGTWYKSFPIAVTTIARATAITPAIGSLIQVSDSLQGGIFNIFPKAGYTVDNGLVFQMTSDANYVLVRNTNGYKEVNVKWFGAYADSTHDDADAVQAAVNTGWNVYFPEGKYRLTKIIKTTQNDNITFRGDGMFKSRLIRDIVATSATGSVGIITAESADSNSYIKGLVFRNLGFYGNNTILGREQYTHLLGLLGTDGTLVDNCGFIGMRGDGLYAGAGKSALVIDRRHNRNLEVKSSYFDGLINECRNGISVIDCDGINVHDDMFKNIGASILSFSVGAIDLERNNAISFYSRDTRIVNNKFYNISSVNTSAITIFCTKPLGALSSLADNHIISNNEMINCFWGISVVNGNNSTQTDGENIKLIIRENTIKYSRIAIRPYGRGIIIDDNWLTGDDAHNNPTHIQISRASIIVDCKITNNHFDSIGHTGVIEIGGFRGLDIEGNTITNSAPFLYFTPDNLEAPYRVMQNLTIRRNRINNRLYNDPTLGTTYYINMPAGFNTVNSLINSTCIEENNTLENRVSNRTSTALNTYFNKSFITGATPNTGTWEVGNELFSLPSSNGSYKLVCSQSGTFGTDATVHTTTLVHNTNRVVYNNILNTKLRVGHVVSFDGVGRYKIIDIQDSIFFLDNFYTGTTGDHVAAWVAPVFKSVTTVSKYTSANGNNTILPSNQGEFIEGNLTADRRYILGWDTTTYGGVNKTIRNNSSGILWLVMGEDGTGGGLASDSVTINGKTDSIPLYSNDELHLLSTAANTWRIQNKLTNTFLRAGNDISYSAGNVNILNHQFYQGDGVGAGTFIKNRITSDQLIAEVPNTLGFTDNTSGFFTSGGFLFKARNGFYFYTNGGAAPKLSAYVNNLGHWSFNGFTPASGSAYVDFRNSDSVGIVLPNMTRNTFGQLTPATPGTIAFGTSLNKVLVIGAGSTVLPLLDSAAAEALYPHKFTVLPPVKYIGDVISVDTGRGISQLVTGGDLNKVKDSVVTLISAANNGLGMIFPVQSTSIGSLSAGVTSYYGLNAASSAQTNPARNKVYVPINCTLKKVYLTFLNGGTLASGETSSFYIRVNNTTDYLISSAVVNNAVFTEDSNTGMSVPLNAGDYFEVKWVQAAWTTAPTNVRFTANIWVQ